MPRLAPIADAAHAALLHTRAVSGQRRGMVQRFVLGRLADSDEAGWVSVSELAWLWASRESARDRAWLGLPASRAEDEAVRRAPAPSPRRG